MVYRITKEKIDEIGLKYGFVCFCFQENIGMVSYTDGATRIATDELSEPVDMKEMEEFAKERTPEGFKFLRIEEYIGELPVSKIKGVSEP